MSSRLEQAANIFCTEGIPSLLRRGSGYLCSTTKRHLLDTYWNARGVTHERSVGGVTVSFEPSTVHGGDKFSNIHEWERDFLQELVDDLRRDDVFYDIGANIGNYTCFAANVITDGQLVAFEPYPPNVEQLERNLSHNAAVADIRIFELALSDSSGTMEFTAPDDKGPGLGTATVHPEGNSMTVESVPGDDLVERENIPVPNVVKIDVEGAEPIVVRGLERTLAHDECRSLYCELHLPSEGRHSFEDFGATGAEMMEMITDLGFDITDEVERGDEIHIRATK